MDDNIFSILKQGTSFNKNTNKNAMEIFQSSSKEYKTM